MATQKALSRKEETKLLPDALKALVHDFPTAVVAFDADYQVTVWNRAAARIFRYRVSQIPGNSFLSLFEDPNFRKKLFPLRQTPEPVEFDCAAIAGNGDRIELNLRVSAVKPTRGDKTAYVALLTDTTEKRFLERAFLEASEQEKKNIGQTLHDDLCQQLVGAAFATKAMGESLRRQGIVAGKQLEDLSRLIHESVRQARDIVRGLHPVELDAGGLMSALDELAHKTNHKIPAKFLCHEPVSVRNPNSALQSYRIVQEALANILRIGSAIKLTIALHKKQNTVTMVIKADGINKRAFIRQVGSLDHKIREYRIKAIDGELSLGTEKSGGLRITCSFPEIK